MKHFDAMQINDFHLGAKNSQHKRLRKFLKMILKGNVFTTDLLIIAGDGVDSPKISRLKHHDWRIVYLLRKISKKMHVVWVVGNHDPDKEVISKKFKIEAVDDLEFESGGKRFYVCHGHQHDKFISKHPFVTSAGDLIYRLSQMVDQSYKMARFLKRRSKSFMRCIERVGFGVAVKAKNNGCDVAWHGHNHSAGNIIIDGVEVWDGGCWTEKPCCSFLTAKDGKVKLTQWN